MVGQVKLLQLIDRYIDTGTLPRTLLLEGDYGCGKHTVTSYISEKLSLPVLDITETLSLELLEQITLKPVPQIYLINSSNISVKEQNMILKFLEEPLKNSYIVILAETKTQLLNTVINRCVCLSFEKYTTEELLEFCTSSNADILEFADTPGRVRLFEQHPVTEMKSFSEKIFLQIGIANYSNILTIPNRINFKDNDKLFDFDVFVFILIHVAMNLYIKGMIPYKAYLVTDEFYNDTKIPHINKLQLFEHYLFRLKLVYEEASK